MTAGRSTGGSGCGCSAVTLCAHILPKLMRGEWNPGAVCAHRRAAVYRRHTSARVKLGPLSAVMLERSEVNDMAMKLIQSLGYNCASGADPLRPHQNDARPGYGNAGRNRQCLRLAGPL
ncbi:MAG: hypothetical protein ACLSE4_11845 [Clostridium sp.]